MHRLLLGRMSFLSIIKDFGKFCVEYSTGHATPLFFVIGCAQRNNAGIEIDSIPELCHVRCVPLHTMLRNGHDGHDPGASVIVNQS